jgi:hypothetical protein
MKGLAGLRPLLACALALGAGRAQVFPAAFASNEAPGTEFWLLSPFTARRQLVIDQGAFGSLAKHPIVGLAVRRNMGDTDRSTGGKLWVEISLSHSPRSANAKLAVFGNNRGKDQRQVFAGTITVPGAPPAPSAPAPWTAPYSVTFPFSTPFRYAGGPLCIETLTLTTPPGGAAFATLPWWPIDAFIADPTGSAHAFGSSCIAAMPGQPAGAEPGTLAAGATAVYYLRGPRRSGSGMCMIGTSDSQLGSLQLPLDLGPLGAPGCQLLNDIVTMLPFTLTAFPYAALGYASVELPVPNQPSAVGATMYSQWLMSAPGCNALAATTSNSVKATIGAAADPFGATWIEALDPGAGDGRVLKGRVPVVLFLRG